MVHPIVALPFLFSIFRTRWVTIATCFVYSLTWLASSLCLSSWTGINYITNSGSWELWVPGNSVNFLTMFKKLFSSSFAPADPKLGTVSRASTWGFWLFDEVESTVYHFVVQHQKPELQRHSFSATFHMYSWISKELSAFHKSYLQWSSSAINPPSPHTSGISLPDQQHKVLIPLGWISFYAFHFSCSTVERTHGLWVYEKTPSFPIFPSYNTIESKTGTRRIQQEKIPHDRPCWWCIVCPKMSKWN